METEYLVFEEAISKSGKTAVLLVFSARSGWLLGRIAWLGKWRQYAFFPEPKTAWNPQCLNEINSKIALLMEARSQAQEAHQSSSDTQ